MTAGISRSQVIKGIGLAAGVAALAIAAILVALKRAFG